MPFEINFGGSMILGPSNHQKLKIICVNDSIHMRKKVCIIKDIWSPNCTLGGGEGEGDAPLLPKLYRLFLCSGI